MAIDGWRIDEGAVRRVLADAQRDADELSELEVSLTQALSSAKTAVSGKATATAGALDTLLTDPFEIDLASMEQHVGTAISATRKAVDAYVAGDEHMAAQYDGKVDPS
jgi:hypothetical protein